VNRARADVSEHSASAPQSGTCNAQCRNSTVGVEMAFWSWLDVPVAVVVLAAARGVPLWLDRRNSAIESDEQLAEPGCLADALDPQDLVMPQLTSCPQCGLPAEIRESFNLRSTDGPIEHVALSCIVGHHFRMAADRLPATPLAESRQFDPVRPARTSGPPTTW
jgi:hypothetical protein